MSSSIAIINASVGNSLTVAGTTTLSGALTSASSLACQGITTTSLLVNGDTILSGDLICKLQKQTTGINNLILGSGIKGSEITTGSNNVGIGYQVMDQTETGSYNISIGFQAGGGVCSDNNICIGRNSGIEPKNSFSQSVCIGINSKITASNQISLGTIQETLQILGSLSTGSSTITNTQLSYLDATSSIQSQLNTASSQSTSLQTKLTGINYSLSTTIVTGNFAITSGSIYLNDNIIYLRPGDTKHSLGYDSTIDGPSLQGNGGGKFGTQTNSSMLSWNNQIVKVSCPIEMTVSTGACMRMNGAPLYFGYLGDGETYLQVSDAGTSIQSKSSGRIGTTLKNDIITWNSTSGINASINANTNITGYLNVGGIVNLNDKPLYLRGSGNTDHSLTFNVDVQGPALQGYSGGKLGTVGKSDIVTWNSTSGVNTVSVNGNLQIAATNELRMNLAPIYLKTTGDNNHVLRYVGGAFDGPSLQGAAGGTLRTVTTSAVLTWSDTSVNMNVPLISNTNIQQPTSGYFVNFYRKTNCTTSETYNFQSAHGKYDVYYNANHDRNTSSFHHVDICNNVNSGSFSIALYKGSGISLSIDTNTNIMTINCTVAGGTLQINRTMAYN